MSNVVRKVVPYAFVADSVKNITLDAMKRSKDDKGLFIRLIYRHNKAGITSLDYDRPVHAVWICNLMEIEEIKFDLKSAKHRFKLQ